MWAESYSKIIGHDIWGFTTQNEPGFYNNVWWEACSYSADDMVDFVAN